MSLWDKWWPSLNGLEDSECVCCYVLVLRSKAAALNFSDPSVLEGDLWSDGVCGGDGDSIGGCRQIHWG